MNSRIALTSRRIAAIVAVFGTLFTVGGTLTLAEHYARGDAGARTSITGVNLGKLA